VSFVIAVTLFGGILHLLCRYQQLWQRSQHLEQQLHHRQQQMKQTWTEIHNGPLQLLAFLMREVEIHDLAQQELLQHLQNLYQDVVSGTQILQGDSAHDRPIAPPSDLDPAAPDCELVG
jgi:hypothetical protein